MTDRELMQMALDALEDVAEDAEESHKTVSAIEALRARLAQPESELEYWNAVEGWVKIDEVRQHFDIAGCGTIYKTAGEGRVPLYAAREWINLTVQEREKLRDEYEDNPSGLISAVQIMLKEKNT